MTLNSYKFKAVIEGIVVGENYNDAIENIENPALIVSIDKAKVKNVEKYEEEE